MTKLLRHDLIGELTTFAKMAAVQAGHAILPHFRSQLTIDNKLESLGQGWDPVTAGDRAAEQVIRALIEKHYPDHGIIGEEFGTKPPKSDFTWILDPIDGTRAFVIGMPTWATLIGLYHQDQPLLGVMHQPFVGDLFVGNPFGAWLINGNHERKLKAASTRTLSSALVGTTAPHLYSDPVSAHGLANINAKCRSMRYGGDAYFFALVGAGLLDVAMDCGLQIYDIAALIPIMRGAGATVGTWTGDDPDKGGNILCSATPELYAEALAQFSGS
jgi:myo-inositol-1(or 4)-monophosphatase